MRISLNKGISSLTLSSVHVKFSSLMFEVLVSSSSFSYFIHLHFFCIFIPGIFGLIFLVIRSSFRKHPLDQAVSLGSKVVLFCKPPRGKPKPQLTWLKDNLNVVIDGTRRSLENNDQKLIIKSFQENDEGTYNCEATNVAGRRLSNPAVVVRNGEYWELRLLWPHKTGRLVN